MVEKDEEKLVAREHDTKAQQTTLCLQIGLTAKERSKLCKQAESTGKEKKTALM